MKPQNPFDSATNSRAAEELQRRRRSSNSSRAAAATLLALGLTGTAVVTLVAATAPAARAQAPDASPTSLLPPAPFGAAKATLAPAPGTSGASVSSISASRFNPNLNDITVSRWYNFGPFALNPLSPQFMGRKTDPLLGSATSVTGRVNGVAYHPLNPKILYVATAGGGVWKYDGNIRNSKGQDPVPNKPADYGQWTPLSDKWPVLQTSCVALPRQNANLILAGTGDFDGDTAVGIGIMRSTNGGNSWSNVGTALKTVTAIAFDPDNPNVVMATSYDPAKISNPGAPGNGGSGGDIWRSTDGGATWTAVTPKTPLDDFEDGTNQTDPTKPVKQQIGEGWSDIEFSAPGAQMAVGTSKRYVWAVSRRGGLYRSDDNGITFNRVAPNAEDANPQLSSVVNAAFPATFPTGPNTADPAPFYFTFRYNPIQATISQLYPRADNNGGPPYKISPQDTSQPQLPDAHSNRNDPFRGGYGLELAVSPTNPEAVYIIDSNANFQDGRLWRTQNAGRTWDEITGFYLTNEGQNNTWSLSNYALTLTAMPGLLTGSPTSTVADVLFGGTRELLWSDNAGQDWLRVDFSLSGQQNPLDPKFHTDQHDVAFPRVYDAANKLRGVNEFVVANDGGVYRITNFNRSDRDLSSPKYQVDYSLNDTLVATQFFSAAFDPSPSRPNQALGGLYNNGFVRTARTAKPTLPDGPVALFDFPDTAPWHTLGAVPSTLMTPDPVGAPQDSRDNRVIPPPTLDPDTRKNIFARKETFGTPPANQSILADPFVVANRNNMVSDLEEEMSIPFFGATTLPDIRVNGIPVPARNTGPFPDPTTDDGNVAGWQPTGTVNLRVWSAAEAPFELGNGYGGAVTYDYDENTDSSDVQYVTTLGTGKIVTTTDNWRTSLDITPDRLITARNSQGQIGSVTVNGGTRFAFPRFDPQDTQIASDWQSEVKAPVPAMVIDSNPVSDNTHPVLIGAQYLWRYDRSGNAGHVYVRTSATDPGNIPLPNIDRGYWRRVGSTQLATDEGAYITAIAYADFGNRIYVGTSDGNLWMTRTGRNQSGGTGVQRLTASWTRLNGATLPSRLDPPAVPSSERHAITSISVNPRANVDGQSPSNSDILVGIDGKGVFRCANTLGSSFIFTPQNGSIPGRRLSDITLNVRSVVRDTITLAPDGQPDATNSFFVGTDRGLYYTNDQGSSWYDASGPLGLPYVDVRTLDVNNRTGFVNIGTFGRGLWRFNLGAAVQKTEAAPILAYTTALTRINNTIQVTVTMRNDGGTVDNVNVTGAQIQSSKGTTAGTITNGFLGTLGGGAGGAKVFIITFPATAGARGEVATFSLSGTYLSTGFGSTFPSVGSGNTPIITRLRLP